jgi:hypothetical protein
MEREKAWGDTVLVGKCDECERECVEQQKL